MAAGARYDRGRVLLLQVISALALGVCGCDSGRTASGGSPQAKVTSTVLTNELNRALDEFVSVPRSFARRSEPKVYDRAATLKEVSTAMPDFLVVTGEDEARFAKGNFDDAANRARVQRAAPAFDPQWGITPTFVNWMLGEDHAHPFTGARLELLAHIADRETQVLSKVATQGRSKK